MNIDLTIKNYRCFSDEKPARFSVRDGFTALLGINNSGKSSLLRFFYEFRQLFNALQKPNNVVEALRGQLRDFSPQPTIRDLSELFWNQNNRAIEITIRLLETMAAPLGKQHVPEQYLITVPRPTNTFSLRIPLPGDPIVRGASIAFRSPATLIAGDTPVANLQPLFDCCKALANTLYIGPFRNAINVGAKNPYFDIQVGQAFVQEWRQFKTGPVIAKNEATVKLTHDIRRIFGLGHLEINPTPNDDTLQLFVNQRSYLLGELGAGLAQFIVVLANAATKGPVLILIDEPELNLHPSLQLDFLTTLGSYAANGVMFATHSYGLARARAQHVYTLRPEPDAGTDLKPLESTPRLAELLGELSFSAYRELGFDKILLVEGVTEVLAIQQFLRLYGKDHKIVLLPLGGSAMIKGDIEAELMEIARITPNVAALIDSERSVAGEAIDASRADFVAACGRAKIACHVLDRMATENYLTDAAVKKVKGPKYRALAQYEKLKSMNPAWGKGDNWRIAREMSLADVDGTDLGTFLRSL